MLFGLWDEVRSAIDEFDFRPATNAELAEDMLGGGVGLADFVVLFESKLAHNECGFEFSFVGLMDERRGGYGLLMEERSC